MIGYSKAVMLIITLVFIAAACTVPSQPADNPSEPADNTNPNGGEDVLQSQDPDENGTVPGNGGLVPGGSHQNGSGTEIDYDTIKANEAGKIMVLMYHVIGDAKGNGPAGWITSERTWRSCTKGYRLISLNDYISNNIDIEAGYTPVVITFDDGTQGQFNILKENGEFKVDPKCAVSIMEKFYSKHPDFGLEATFLFTTRCPWQKDLVEYKLRYLVEKGMDIGNHTYGHANLGQQDAAGVRSQLGRMVAEQKYLPDNVNALALPYRANAKEQYREYVYSGSMKE